LRSICTAKKRYCWRSR